MFRNAVLRGRVISVNKVSISKPFRTGSIWYLKLFRQIAIMKESCEGSEHTQFFKAVNSINRNIYVQIYTIPHKVFSIQERHRHKTISLKDEVPWFFRKA